MKINNCINKQNEPSNEKTSREQPEKYKFRMVENEIPWPSNVTRTIQAARANSNENISKVMINGNEKRKYLLLEQLQNNNCNKSKTKMKSKEVNSKEICNMS